MTTFFLTAKSTSSSSHRPYMANIYISYDIFTYILCVLLYYDRLYYDLVKEFVAQDLFFLCSGIFFKEATDRCFPSPCQGHVCVFVRSSSYEIH